MVWLFPLYLSTVSANSNILLIVFSEEVVGVRNVIKLELIPLLIVSIEATGESIPPDNKFNDLPFEPAGRPVRP